MKKLLLLLLSFVTLAFTGCFYGEDLGPTEPEVGSISLSKTSVSVPSEANMVSVEVTSPYAWKATTNAAWIEVEVDGTSTLNLYVEKNTTTEERTATVVVSCDSYNLAAELTVVQAAGEAAPEVTVIEFYADTTSGIGECQNSMSLLMAVGMPGHWLTLTGGDVMATLFMLDFSGDPMQYAYLKEGVYPVVAGSLDMGNIPMQTCLMADPGYCNFYVFSSNKEYYPVVPESDTDADGMPYGVMVHASPATTGMDLSYLEFNIPVVDIDGNPAVIRGCYMGSLMYELGGGAGGAKQTYDFNMQQYGFTTFEATYNEEYKTLALVSNSQNGMFRMNFNLNYTDGVWAGQAFDCVEGGGALSGYYWDQLDDAQFDFDSGRVLVEATETPGVYTLVISSRNPLYFWGQRYDLQMEGEYTITVTGLPENLK